MGIFNSYLEQELNDLDANSDLYALLISDDNSFGRSSSMADIAGLEISTTNGYARQLQTFSGNASVAATGKYERVGDAVAFSASGGSMDQFSHIIFVKGATGTQGNTSGTPVAFEPVDPDGSGNPQPITLSDGQAYEHTRTFSSEDV